MILGKKNIFDMKFALSQLIHFELYKGYYVQYWNPDTNPFLIGSHSKIHLMKGEFIFFFLRRSLKFVENLGFRLGFLIFIDSNKFISSYKLFPNSKLSRFSSTFIVVKNWIRGAITNYFMLFHCKKVRFSRLPSCVFISELNDDILILNEAKWARIPIIAPINSNTYFGNEVTYFFPCNNKSVRSLCFIFLLIKNAYIKGYKQRIYRFRNIAFVLKKGLKSRLRWHRGFYSLFLIENGLLFWSLSRLITLKHTIFSAIYMRDFKLKRNIWFDLSFFFFLDKLLKYRFLKVLHFVSPYFKRHGIRIKYKSRLLWRDALLNSFKRKLHYKEFRSNLFFNKTFLFYGYVKPKDRKRFFFELNKEKKMFRYNKPKHFIRKRNE